MLKEELKVYQVLDKLEIPFERYEHEAQFTVKEANNSDIKIEGQHCKNLFIRNRKGDKHYLVVLDDKKTVDLKVLATEIESTSLSFASEERLYKYLGVKPGSVTPFGLINDFEKHVEVLVDKGIINSDTISFHPNINTVTITLKYSHFEKYLKWCGNKIKYVQL